MPCPTAGGSYHPWSQALAPPRPNACLGGGAGLPWRGVPLQSLWVPGTSRGGAALRGWSLSPALSLSGRVPGLRGTQSAPAPVHTAPLPHPPIPAPTQEKHSAGFSRLFMVLGPGGGGRPPLFEEGWVPGAPASRPSAPTPGLGPSLQTNRAAAVGRGGVLSPPPALPGPTPGPHSVPPRRCPRTEDPQSAALWPGGASLGQQGAGSGPAPRTHLGEGTGTLVCGREQGPRKHPVPPPRAGGSTPSPE